jgi:hypothetical protein
MLANGFWRGFFHPPSKGPVPFPSLRAIPPMRNIRILLCGKGGPVRWESRWKVRPTRVRGTESNLEIFDWADASGPGVALTCCVQTTTSENTTSEVRIACPQAETAGGNRAR